MKKIYCKNCKYYFEILHPTEGFSIVDKCGLKFGYANSCVENKKIYDDVIDHNGDNNCKYYKKKWWKLWIN